MTTMKMAAGVKEHPQRSLRESEDSSLQRRHQILDATVGVIGRLGIKKASVDDIASAAGLSKQGLYLHFSSKEELIAAAMRRYFEEGLRLVEDALQAPVRPLGERLVDALDAWFGRHLVHFNPATLELVQPQDVHPEVEAVKARVRALLAQAIETAPELRQSKNVCTPKELARTLFQFGLTWKEGHSSREAFRSTLETCVRACLQLKWTHRRARGSEVTP